MMTSSNREVYEGKILETLVKNSERLAVVEFQLTDVKSEVKKINSKVENIDSRLINVENKLSVVESEVKSINAKMNWLFGAIFAVGASILAALYSQPILNALSHLK